jgi:hypothetical protein
MPFFPRFARRWADTGVVAEPTNAQADSGFGFLGANPPTVELFNAIQQWNDDKDTWLYDRLVEVMSAGGVTPNAAGVNQLLNALRALFQVGWVPFTTSQSWIVPAGVTTVRARVWGGGGAGGNATGAGSAGGGGGGGGFSGGKFTVTPGASVFLTIGTAGLTAGQAGGLSSFGSFCSATGGQSGASSFGGFAAGGAGGIGTGGQLNIPGVGGGSGQTFDIGTTGGGLGGSSPFGGGLSPLSVGANGNFGLFPGGGASGAGVLSGSGASMIGGQGAPGYIELEW